jgi:hypothetical protein
MPSGVNVLYDIIVLYFLKDYCKLLEKKEKFLQQQLKKMKIVDDGEKSDDKLFIFHFLFQFLV